jgi:hypothetical protein
MKLYMFRRVPLSIIRSYSLYTQQWYMSYRFADSYRTGSGLKSVPSWSCTKERGIRRDVILSGTQNTTETLPLRKPEIIRTHYSPEPPWCYRIMLGVHPFISTLLSTYSPYRVCSLTFDFVKTCRKLNVVTDGWLHYLVLFLNFSFLFAGMYEMALRIEKGEWQP